MKKNLAVLVFGLFILLSPKAYSQESFKWPAMNNFHSTAMHGFHNAEANKLKPARDSAAAALKQAEAWQMAAVPDGLDAAVIKPLIEKLVADCKAVNEAVEAKKSDAVLKPLVLKAHNSFHAIVAKVK